MRSLRTRRPAAKLSLISTTSGDAMSSKRHARLQVEALEARALPSTYYVAPYGNAAGPGTDEDPWRTLQRAANAVRAGDDVTVRAGNYAGFDLRTSGTAANPIRFLADSGTVIDAPNPRTPDGINLEG